MFLSPKNTYLIFKVLNNKIKLDNIMPDRNAALLYCYKEIKGNHFIEMQVIEETYNTVTSVRYEKDYIGTILDRYTL